MSSRKQNLVLRWRQNSYEKQDLNCSVNNNNNNIVGHKKKIIIIIMFIVISWWQSHCASSPGSFDECRTVPSGRRPKTKPDDLGWSAWRVPESTPTIAIYYYYSAWKLILIYRPTEGKRLSRPGWLVTYRDGLPARRRSPILVLTGSHVAQLRWSRPTRYL